MTLRSPAAAPPAPPEPLRILLVEDDAADAMLVEEALFDSDLEADLRPAGSWRAAAAELAADRFDCVLLDLHLPDGSGLRLLDEVRDAAPETAVVVLSGWSESEAGLAAVSVGAQDYLLKGAFDPRMFARTIRYAVERKRVETTTARLEIERIRSLENQRLEAGLLPQPVLVRGDFDVHHRYRPSRHGLLSGDFYDVVQTADGAVHAVIGDVAGHGPAEAALGVSLRVAWRALTMAGLSGPEVIQLLEDLLMAERQHGAAFATLTTVRLPPDRRHAQIIRAGHPGLLLRTADGIDLVTVPGGLAIGMLPGTTQWQREDLPLPPGAHLVLFTDGLFEWPTRNGRMDLSGLVALARDAASLPAEPFLDVLVGAAESAAADGGRIDDDIAVLYLGWR